MTTGQQLDADVIEVYYKLDNVQIFEWHRRVTSEMQFCVRTRLVVGVTICRQRLDLLEDIMERRGLLAAAASQ